MEINNRPLSCNVSSEDVYRMLDGYFEGIDATRSETLSSHLKNCDCCSDVMQFQLGLRTVIGSGCREELPDDVRQRLLESLHKLR